MAKLHDLLRNKYKAWRDDVPASWKPPLQGIEPDFAGVPTNTSIAASVPIIPRLKSDPIPGAPAGAGALRALDRVTFHNVRVVVMGQDPYPRKRQATGRAFEQGGWVRWDATSDQAKVPASFRRIIQRLAQHRTGNNAYLTGWNKVTTGVANGVLTLAPPRTLYDAWEDQGVIFLNKVLTYTKPAHVDTHHAVLWRPVVARIIQQLASRPSGVVVFALWGAQPQSLRPLIRSAAIAANAWNTRVKVVTASHPATAAFFAGPNPFKKINDALSAIGGASGTPITW